MKVLVENKWSLTVSCRECTSQLEVERDDVHVVEYEELCDDFFAVCSVCSSNVELSSSKIPSGIQKQARLAARAAKGKRS